MDKHVLIAAGFVAALTANGTAHAATDATGVWIDHTGRGGVEISECGANLCGRIVWLKEGTNKKGCGVQIIGNAKPVGKDTWDGGWIYDPEKNAKYSVELKPVGSDKLRVVGYMGSKLFSETMIWKRASADLKRCDAADAGVTAPSAPKSASPPKDGPAPQTGSAARDASKDKTAYKPLPANGCTKYFPQIGEVVAVPCPR